MKISEAEIGILKDNKMPYCECSTRVQAIIDHLRKTPGAVEFRDQFGYWHVPLDNSVFPGLTYRIKADYQPEPEPEFEFVEVDAFRGRLKFDSPGDGATLSVTLAPDHVNFAGFADENKELINGSGNVSETLADHHDQEESVEIKYVVFRKGE